ncbi:hypothetical protein RL2177 [Rhizobium johnstonii 3841]|uniref:Uncharacterized protein n=1 Tax=Rhizobium johnstonii (strain DSM 114642 / LMG 32736 / 3841) TaxID=216596 RepID=Q1MH97_RHIJ3|nr:hypothetical protein RL2177 [Rhizobium johnstonii 3841]
MRFPDHAKAIGKRKRSMFVENGEKAYAVAKRYIVTDVSEKVLGVLQPEAFVDFRSVDNSVTMRMRSRRLHDDPQFERHLSIGRIQKPGCAVRVLHVQIRCISPSPNGQRRRRAAP